MRTWRLSVLFGDGIGCVRVFDKPLKEVLQELSLEEWPNVVQFSLEASDVREAKSHA